MAKKRKIHIRRDEDFANLDAELEDALTGLDGANEKVSDLLGAIAEQGDAVLEAIGRGENPLNRASGEQTEQETEVGASSAAPGDGMEHGGAAAEAPPEEGLREREGEGE